MNIGVLASHTGTTLQAVLDACGDGSLDANVSVVVSNNSGSGALQRARAHGVPTHHLSSQTHSDDEALDRAIADALSESDVHVLLLAGYMKRLGPLTLQRFAGRIINTHPALLPKFGGLGMYGSRVHQAVLDAGDAFTGATVHWVDGEYDTGEPIAQVEVAVQPGDTVESLAARVQERERQLVVLVLARMARGEIPLPFAA